MALRVSAAPVDDLACCFACGPVAELDMTLRWGDRDAIEVVGSPLRLDGQRPCEAAAPPALGEHDEVVRRHRDW